MEKTLRILDRDGQYVGFGANLQGSPACGSDLPLRIIYRDISGLSGMNGYCDSAAAAALRAEAAEAGCMRFTVPATEFSPAASAGAPATEFSPAASAGALATKPSRTAPAGVSNIRLFGSGNYHYISKFFLERMEVPFDLLLIDRHPDMEEPAFPILSCGSWVFDSLREVENLRTVYMYGVRRDLLAACFAAEAAPFAGRIVDLGESSGEETVKSAAFGDLLSGSRPLYISIDKDALSTDYAATDWDQGDLTPADLKAVLSVVMKKRTVAGCDICGDGKEAETASTRALNWKVNEELIAFLAGASS